MELADALMQHLENQARQTLLNQALFRLIEQSNGSVTLPMSVLNSEGMGGVVVEVDPKAETVTLKSVNCEQAQAYEQSQFEEKH